MQPQTKVYIILAWREEGHSKTGSVPILYNKERRVYTPDNYPKRLACSNPRCKDGGFEIGDKIAHILATGDYDEYNSLGCSNGIQPVQPGQCSHIIRYTISCVYPYQRLHPNHTLKMAIPSLST